MPTTPWQMNGDMERRRWDGLGGKAAEDLLHDGIFVTLQLCFISHACRVGGGQEQVEY